MTEEIVRQIVLDTVAKAGTESGWVSGMFAAIVFGGLISLGVIVWQVLRAYFDTQNFIRDKLSTLLAESNQVIASCSAAMRQFTDAIQRAPCGRQDHTERENKG